MKYRHIAVILIHFASLSAVQSRHSLASKARGLQQSRQTQSQPGLTTQEVEKIESELGITLSAEEKLNIASIAKAPASATWRTAAENRIEYYRKADLNIEVIDEVGNPLPDATVSVKTKQNAFKFGGIMKAIDFGNHGGQVSDPERFKTIFLKLFNSAGLENEFKPKYAFSFHNNYVPDFMAWAKGNDLPVRGHTLIWPGESKLPASGDYDLLTPYKNLQSALADQSPDETMISELTEQLRDKVNFVIGDWVSKWDGIYEWDVLNEPIGNTALQSVLGHEESAEWFKTAAANVPNGNECKLMVNQWGIISMAPPPSTTYDNYRNKYMNRIDYIINGGGRLDRIGFQSRVKRGYIHPSDIYGRLQDFALEYGIEMVGTEFEVVPNGEFQPTELDRATITEEWLTTYFSHPLVTGLNAWTYQGNDAKALTYSDGTIKLNGLIWYYLHRIKYSTDEMVMTDEQGSASVRAFKGDYEITVELNGVQYPFDMSFTENTTFSTVLPVQATSMPITPAPTTQEPTPAPQMNLFTGVVEGVSTDSWTTVTLPNTFNSMVVVTTPVLASKTDLAVLTRVREASGGSFQIKLQNPGGANGLTRTVHYMVAEEGVYNNGSGVHFEAQKVVSTGTTRKGFWDNYASMEQIILQDSFSDPVVFGQVMSENDSRWSLFWSRGSSTTSPADSANIYVGKHVASDSEFDRIDETLGVIIMETASKAIDENLGVKIVEVGVGSDTVRGVSNLPPYNYSFEASTQIPQVAIATQAAQDGNSGSWAVLYGTIPVGASTLSLALEEDTATRRHTTEQVSYVIFE